MPDRRPEEQIKDLSDAVREAVERTFAATADSASGTRERAGELLDEVSRRGTDALDEVSRRGSDTVAALRKEVDSLRRRLADLENKAKPKG